MRCQLGEVSAERLFPNGWAVRTAESGPDLPQARGGAVRREAVLLSYVARRAPRRARWAAAPSPLWPARRISPAPPASKNPAHDGLSRPSSNSCVTNSLHRPQSTCRTPGTLELWAGRRKHGADSLFVSLLSPSPPPGENMPQNPKRLDDTASCEGIGFRLRRSVALRRFP